MGYNPRTITLRNFADKWIKTNLEGALGMPEFQS